MIHTKLKGGDFLDSIKETAPVTEPITAPTTPATTETPVVVNPEPKA